MIIEHCSLESARTVMIMMRGNLQMMTVIVFGLLFMACHSKPLHDDDVQVYSVSQIQNPIVLEEASHEDTKGMVNTGSAPTRVQMRNVMGRKLAEKTVETIHLQHGHGQSDHHPSTSDDRHLSQKRRILYVSAPASEKSSPLHTFSGVSPMHKHEESLQKTELDDLDAKKSNAVAWPRASEKHDQPTFHVDYTAACCMFAMNSGFVFQLWGNQAVSSTNNIKARTKNEVLPSMDHIPAPPSSNKSPPNVGQPPRVGTWSNSAQTQTFTVHAGSRRADSGDLIHMDYSPVHRRPPIHNELSP
eukprot:Gb_06197 [translate_table: standard]